MFNMLGRKYLSKRNEIRLFNQYPTDIFIENVLVSNEDLQAKRYEKRKILAYNKQ